MNTRPKWRGWRYNKATPEQKLLTLAGVPEIFWSKGTLPDFRPIVFENIKGEKQTISPGEQSKWAKRLRQPDELVKGYLVAVGSIYEDRQSLQLVFDWVRRYIVEKKQIKVKVINLADVPHRNERSLGGTPVGKTWWDEASSSQILVMHNILGKDCSSDRIQTARDIITRFPFATRILVVAGDNPITFCQEVIHEVPDVYFYTDGLVQKRVSH